MDFIPKPLLSGPPEFLTKTEEHPKAVGDRCLLISELSVRSSYYLKVVQC